MQNRRGFFRLMGMGATTVITGIPAMPVATGAPVISRAASSAPPITLSCYDYHRTEWKLGTVEDIDETDEVA